MAQRKANVRLVDANGIVNPVTGGVGQAVDGETVVAGNAVLLINPPNGDAYAGPWIAAVGAWTRATDWDTIGEIQLGDEWYVEDGSPEFKGSTWHFDDDAVPTTLDVDSLTIGLKARRRVPEPGRQLVESGDTPPIWDVVDESEVNFTFKEGLRLEYISATSVRIKAGACRTPDGTLINSTSDITLTGLTLTSGTLYYIYAYDVGGGVLGIDTPSLQRPATAFREDARAKGGGTGGVLDNTSPDTEPDLTRRHIATIYASATNTVLRFRVNPDGFVQYITDYESGSTVISSGTSNQTNATRSAAQWVPATSREVMIHFFPGAGAAGIIAHSDTSGDLYTVSNASRADVRVPLSAAREFLQRNTAAGGSAITSVIGYWENH